MSSNREKSPEEVRVQEGLMAFFSSINKSDTDAMTAALAGLDRIAAEDGARLDPRLAHFLQRRSYAKALEWLGGQTPTPGVCGGRG
jgi:hypothetical protein